MADTDPGTKPGSGRRAQPSGSRRKFAAVAAVTLALFVAGCAPSPPGRIVDQSHVGAPQAYASVVWGASCDGGTVDAEIAQTFTAGRTGVLDQVSVAAMPIVPGSQAPFIVTIRTVRWDEAPSSKVLGSGTYTGAGSPDPSSLVDIPLGSPAFVVRGHRYSIVASAEPAPECTDDQGWSFFGSLDSYGAGQAWWRGTAYDTPDWTAPGTDHFFRTWVRH